MALPLNSSINLRTLYDCKIHYEFQFVMNFEVILENTLCYVHNPLNRQQNTARGDITTEYRPCKLLNETITVGALYLHHHQCYVVKL